MEFLEATLTKIVQETSDSYSFIITIPEGFTWKAGQHVAWQINGFELDAEDRNTRVFTIASTMADGYLMFTTRIADKHTSFKEALLRKIKPGDKIGVARPLGTFALDAEGFKKTLIVAGGIGITPIRALLRAYKDHPVCYKDFWKDLETVPGVEVRLISDREIFMKDTDTYAKDVQNDAEYLIAGSPGMNNAFTERLEGLGIKKENIKTDVFIGY